MKKLFIVLFLLSFVGCTKTIKPPVLTEVPTSIPTMVPTSEPTLTSTPVEYKKVDKKNLKKKEKKSKKSTKKVLESSGSSSSKHLVSKVDKTIKKRSTPKLSNSKSTTRESSSSEIQKNFYIVSKGDCLWSISAKKNIYSTPWNWVLIYKANYDRITDPNLIYIDQSLVIPRPTEDEVNIAVDEAKHKYKNKKGV